MDSLDIVFCVDAGGLIGLHVTVSTMLRHLNFDAPVRIHILHEGITERQFASLGRTIHQAEFSGQVQVLAQPVDVSAFASLRNHVGQGWMTYARLLAPRLVSVSRLLYLDADLLVFADLSELWQHDLQGHVLGAASWVTVRESNDFGFYEARGLPTDNSYFNAGVLLIDCEKWNKSEATSRCLAEGQIHGKDLPSADQTILNLMFANEYSQIERRFNTPVSAGRTLLSPEDYARRVVHLVARPKPWDTFGSLNGQARTFDEAIQLTDLKGFRRPLPTIKSLRLLRMYFKCVRRRLSATVRRS